MVLGGRDGDAVVPVIINGEFVLLADEWEFLGVTLVKGKHLSFSPKPELRSFHRAFNSIFYSSECPNEQVLVELLYTNCVPILTHTGGVKLFKNNDLNLCQLAVNSAFRKIFKSGRTDSMTNLREFFGKKSIKCIFEDAQIKFELNALHSPIGIIKHLAGAF